VGFHAEETQSSAALSILICFAILLLLGLLLSSCWYLLMGQKLLSWIAWCHWAPSTEEWADTAMVGSLFASGWRAQTRALLLLLLLINQATCWFPSKVSMWTLRRFPFSIHWPKKVNFSWFLFAFSGYA
jgi:hypothetical protein